MKPFWVVLFLTILGGCTALQPKAKAPARTPAEQRIQTLIQEDGIHVVHFWAPWCGNSKAELKAGWYELIESYKTRSEVKFTFVTIWNDGQSGRERMDQYLIPKSVEEVLQPDLGASSDHSKRRKTFLGMPLIWVPTTWVFHQNGKLAYAFNYGEMTMEQVRAAIEGAKASWSHE